MFDRFGHVMMVDTGTSVGEISGQSKPINSADFRPSRPFRIITGSEDNTIGVFEGPPFKFKCTKKVLNACSMELLEEDEIIIFNFSIARNTLDSFKLCATPQTGKNLHLVDLMEKSFFTPEKIPN